MLTLLDRHLGEAHVNSGGPFITDVAHLAKLSADRVHLGGPVCSKHGVDAVCLEEVVELVLGFDARGLLGLAVLGVPDAEFVAICRVPVAEVEALIGVPGAVTRSPAPEIIVVMVVGVRVRV